MVTVLKAFSAYEYFYPSVMVAVYSAIQFHTLSLSGGAADFVVNRNSVSSEAFMKFEDAAAAARSLNEHVTAAAPSVEEIVLKAATEESTYTGRSFYLQQVLKFLEENKVTLLLTEEPFKFQTCMGVVKRELN